MEKSPARRVATHDRAEGVYRSRPGIMDRAQSKRISMLENSVAKAEKRTRKSPPAASVYPAAFCRQLLPEAMMKVQFLGAAQTVTGSCYMIEACGKRFCIDCGMHQGNKAIDARNREIEVYRPTDIDFVLITHAHIDHSGLLPRIVRDGFNNPVYCTKATSELLDLMLQDSAHIQEMEAQWEAKKYMRRGLKNPPAALYTVEDAQKAVSLFSAVDYHKTFEPAPGIRVTYYDAGHILGSGSVRIEADEDGKTTSLIFSGDIGRPQALIVRSPESPPQADYVFMESTYGDRDHKNEETSDQELAEAIAYSYGKGEKVIIPAFAVERTQEVLYCLHTLSKQGKLPEDMPVYVDSPLAIRATEVFERNRELFDDAAQKLLNNGDNPFALPNLRYTLSVAESQAINDYKGPAIVISASGMCNAGRVRHHLRHNIWKPGASIVFVGYQAVGTPGRKIVEKAKKITLFGEDMDVAARIFTINGFSGHAGQSQLLDWLAPLAHNCAQVVLTHGEIKAQETLAGLIRQRFGLKPRIAAYLEEMVLDGCEVTATVTHETKAHPRVDWGFLTGEVERKWDMFKGKLADVEARPWVEQTDLQEALEKMDYALTRLISRM
ncbi:metallo-beta-lactamase family protein [Desulfovibrio desulfuricans]|uniref:Metallo-beta-lactamase family protein n=2 Tax=Desulfovibrionaceae TaxID=194924 RepID=A0AA94HQA6_DESDE|nr:metallo-beta-lactamase family protein [Desulfovibrio desulfuricans]SPD35799.1 Zn-dependent metallo-hydrolase, mRNA processing [Desulfovibrio sp. G11]